MSFDVNVLSTKPVIKAAASMQNDGGAGNLGYMAQGEKEEKQERKYLDESIFMKKDEGDIFTKNLKCLKITSLSLNLLQK